MKTQAMMDVERAMGADWVQVSEHLEVLVRNEEDKKEKENV